MSAMEQEPAGQVALVEPVAAVVVEQQVEVVEAQVELELAASVRLPLVARLNAIEEQQLLEVLAFHLLQRGLEEAWQCKACSCWSCDRELRPEELRASSLADER